MQQPSNFIDHTGLETVGIGDSGVAVLSLTQCTIRRTHNPDHAIKIGRNVV